jgi:hypothetical protein
MFVQRALSASLLSAFFGRGDKSGQASSRAMRERRRICFLLHPSLRRPPRYRLYSVGPMLQGANSSSPTPLSSLLVF